ncbi:pilus assembly protein TadG-related protein [Brevundimonas lutea]|uniref:pilus assembly protein TadG-related protein n=1 Tax=Brevundimonas lutea TaxID=2293980 RepID=UPI000F034239|nr:pilus assembly protein TadG-related protein [Brevundimonas lutea]
MARFLSAMNRFAARLARAREGAVAMLYALAFPPLLLITVAGVDIHRASTVRMNLQDALDAAALAAARSSATTNEGITAVALPALRANLQAYPEITLREDLTEFTLDSNGVVVGTSKVDVETLLAGFILPPYGQILDQTIQVGSHSEVNRASRNLEVALVLDITGSMNNGKIDLLKDAAEVLVDIVVQTQQSPFYSKMAVVPYSMGVNLDTHAAAARGTPTGSVNITGVSWHSGSIRDVGGVTRANWATVTANGHGFSNGDKVVFWNSSRMDDLNGRVFTVANRNNNSFQLSGVNSSNWSSFRSSDNVKVAKCSRDDCAPTITASGHGLSNGEGVYITDVGGFAGLNNRPYVVSGVSGSTFRINTVPQGQYSSGGKSWCGRYGCTWRVFNNAYGNLTAFEASKCVSERTGVAAYTDASPASAKVGFNYASSNNACPTSTLMPLSSDIGALKSKIDGLQIGGSTAGHIGAAWGWYAVSPNFSSLWTGSSTPGAHDPDRLLKAVILMTDGEFNTPYCSGVIAWDAGDGSGAYQDKINCAATNGDAFDQAEALCDAMRAQGILVYTVGFQVPANGAAANIMRECASSAQTAYLPASGSDLTNAFRAIGRDITRLRISK